jgi:MFS family permease
MSESHTSATSALTIALGAQTSAMLPVFLMGSLAPFLMTDLGLDAFTLGVVVALFYGAAAIGSAALAKLADQAGVWRVARIALYSTAGSGIGIALIAQNWIVAGALLFVAGMANGCIQPASNVMVSRHIPAKRQGVAFGLKQSAIPLATLIGGVAVPLVGLTIGWRWAFGMVSALALLITLGMPRDGAQSLRQTPQTLGYSLPKRTLLMIAVMSGFGAGCANAMAAFLVPSITASGQEPAVAGLILALGSLLAIVVRITVGFTADQRDLPLLRIVAVMFFGGMAAYTILATSDNLYLIILATLMAFGMGWGWAGISILAVSRASIGAVGAATGITQAGVYIGAIIGPVLFGFLVSQYSYTIAWLALAIGAIAATCLAFASDRQLQHHHGLISARQ